MRFAFFSFEEMGPCAFVRFQYPVSLSLPTPEGHPTARNLHDDSDSEHGKISFFSVKPNFVRQIKGNLSYVSPT